MRDFERRFYGGEAGRRAFEEQGLRRVGMRSLRDLVRARTGARENGCHPPVSGLASRDPEARHE
jgi:hypothetical protein